VGKLALTRIPDLAKVGVEGSNPFARSKLLRRLSRVSRCSAAYRPSLFDILQAPFCPEVENGGQAKGLA
jgi:hypothetical protein